MPDDGPLSYGPLFAWADNQAVAHVHVELLGVGKQLAGYLASQPSLIHALSPSQFEELVYDFLYAMGFEPQQVGNTYRKDGGLQRLA
jgi:hypothetical protein